MPEVGVIAVTRVALGIGIGLLLSERLSRDQRKAAGWAMVGAGVATTVPIAWGLISKTPVGEKLQALAA